MAGVTSGTPTVDTPTIGLNYNADDWDFRLKPTATLAINQGKNTHTNSYGIVFSDIMYDLDGKARIIGGTVDVGAYECGNQPIRPTNLHSTATTANSVTLAWGTATYASGYQIRYRQTGSTGAWTTVTVSGGTIATREITGLMANTPYDFQICAAFGTVTTASGNSDWSLTPLSVTTKIKLVTPTLGTVTATHHNEISVAWSAVPDVNGYMVQYATNAAFTTGVGTKTITNGTITSTTIDGLNANTTYYVRIKSIGAGSSWGADYSAAKTVTTKTKLSTPTLGTVSGVHHNEISVAWNTVSNASGYTIQYTTDATFTTGVGTKTVNSSTTSTTITGLTATTTYYVRVMATGIGNYCDSDYSVSKSATTKTKLTAPVLGNVTAAGGNTVSVVWETVSNAGGYTIQYAINSSFSGALMKTVTGGSTTSTTISGLNDSTVYYVRVMATGTGPYCESDYSVTKQVLTIPAVPPNLHGSDTTENSVTLKWNTQPNLTGYTLEYRVSDTSDDWTLHTNPDATATSAIISGLQERTRYEFRLTAINQSGSASAAIIATTIPEGVRFLSFESSSQTADSITLTWDTESQVDSYVLKYRAGGTLDWITASAPAPNMFTATIPGLLPNTQYEFHLMGINDNAPGEIETTATTLCNIPTNLTGTPTVDSVTLSWNVPVGGATSYKLERSLTGENGTWEQIGGTVDTFYTDDDSLESNMAYYYRVSAVNSAGIASASSSILEVKTLLSAPHGLINTDTTASSVSLEWIAVDGATGYAVEWRKSDGSTEWSSVGVDITGATAVVQGLATNMEYEIRVRATNGNPDQNSSWSELLPVTTGKTQLSAPTLGNVTAIGSNTIDVTWSAIGNANGYSVEYATDEEFTIGVGTKTVDSSTTSTAIDGLHANTTYYVRVIATGTGNYIDSNCSAEKSTATLCNVPTVLMSPSQMTTSIDLVWNTPVGGAISYKLERSLTGEDGTWMEIGGTLIDIFCTDDDSLTPNTSYYYRISAVNASGVSTPSSVLEVSTSPIILDTPAVNHRGTRCHSWWFCCNKRVWRLYVDFLQKC